jgi:hypothetical protein
MHAVRGRGQRSENPGYCSERERERKRERRNWRASCCSWWLGMHDEWRIFRGRERGMDDEYNIQRSEI